LGYRELGTRQAIRVWQYNFKKLQAGPRSTAKLMHCQSCITIGLQQLPPVSLPRPRRKFVHPKTCPTEMGASCTTENI